MYKKGYNWFVLWYLYFYINIVYKKLVIILKFLYNFLNINFYIFFKYYNLNFLLWSLILFVDVIRVV